MSVVGIILYFVQVHFQVNLYQHICQSWGRAEVLKKMGLTGPHKLSSARILLLLEKWVADHLHVAALAI